jgi:hypothetical protein
MNVPNTWGLKYMDVASLTWLAYKGQGTTGRWRFSTGKEWTLTNVIERGSFRAVVARSSGKTVLSFSGTDDALDWVDNASQGLAGISWQYAYALSVARSYAANVVTGHSLGGGLATYVAIYGGKQCATVNPAPMNINLASGLAMLRHGNLVTNYVVSGEALDILDILAANMMRPGRIYHVPSTGGANPVNRHLLSFLTNFSAPTKI